LGGFGVGSGFGVRSAWPGGSSGLLLPSWPVPVWPFEPPLPEPPLPEPPLPEPPLPEPPLPEAPLPEPPLPEPPLPEPPLPGPPPPRRTGSPGLPSSPDRLDGVGALLERLLERVLRLRRHLPEQGRQNHLATRDVVEHLLGDGVICQRLRFEVLQDPGVGDEGSFRGACVAGRDRNRISSRRASSRSS
jgi:hypothetical protein